MMSQQSFYWQELQNRNVSRKILQYIVKEVLKGGKLMEPGDIEIISSLFVGLDSRILHMRLLHAATKECESRIKLLHHGNFLSTLIPKAIVSGNKYLSIVEVYYKSF